MRTMHAVASLGSGCMNYYLKIGMKIVSNGFMTQRKK